MAAQTERSMSGQSRRPRRSVLIAVACVLLAVVAAVLAGTLIAVLGSELSCLGGGSSATGFLEQPTRAAVREIPPTRLRLYQQAGKRFDVDWTVLASIGYQECGTGLCAQVYPSGCGGPMQIAIVRESACSPGSGPTIWERYGVDATGDGEADPFSLADAIFTAARLLRVVMGAPPIGGSYAAYRQAACNYYGACADSLVSYADEVMQRAVEYGFQGKGPPGPSHPAATQPAGYQSKGATCGGVEQPSGSGAMGAVYKASSPRHLAPLPSAIGPGQQCDARIVADVVYLARRFGLLVTACYSASGHAASGEHPLGTAIDAVPKDGDWERTRHTAEALGWKEECGASGVVPACARSPFRFIGYNQYSGHGDPSHCLCGGNAHLHLSWRTSASEGEPESRPHYGYEPASWVEVFAIGPDGRLSGSRRGRSNGG